LGVHGLRSTSGPVGLVPTAEHAAAEVQDTPVNETSPKDTPLPGVGVF